MAYMSQEGYDKLVAQLKEMETVQRPAASAAIAEARDKGDLSENAEYDAAKEHQAMLESKISQLKAIIGDAKIIDTSKLDTSTVQILSKVEMKNVKTGMKMLLHHRIGNGSQPEGRQDFYPDSDRTGTAGQEGWRYRRNQNPTGYHQPGDPEHFIRITELL